MAVELNPEPQSTTKPLVLLGGTFDPIHNGHLQTALELSEQLPGSEVRLLPAHQPPHRAAPGVSSAQRLEMVRLAAAELPQLVVDGRELSREKLSYSVDTLAELRAELDVAGEQNRPICFAMGTDAFNGIDSWHQWPRLLELAHIVVCKRPGWHPPEQGIVAELLATRSVETADELTGSTSGLILPLSLTQLEISATQVRQRLANGQSCQYLLPAAVLEYIAKHQLYRA